MFEILALAAVIAVPVFFLWNAIHEFSHLLAVKATIGYQWYKVNLFPQWYGNKWWQVRFGLIQWMPNIGKPATPRQKALISFAPRFANFIAAALFPLFALFPGYWSLLWIMIFGAGLVDFAVGSIGYTEISDLKKGSAALGISPWIARICGFGVIAVSVAIGILAHFDYWPI